MTNKLFVSFKIKNLELKNRFVMSAAADNLDNNPEAQKKRFAELAEGEVGLIISGGTRPNKIEQLDKIAEVVHNKGGKFAIQIVITSGPGVSPWSDPNKDEIAVSVLDKNNVFFNSLVKYGKHHAATDRELEEIINNYAKAAVKAKNAGADAIQIHAAHQNFLS